MVDGALSSVFFKDSFLAFLDFFNSAQLLFHSFSSCGCIRGLVILQETTFLSELISRFFTMLTRRTKTFHFQEKLGSGSFAEVFLVKRTPPSPNWITAAAKIIRRPGKDAFQEADLLKRQHHPNIIKYLDSFEDSTGALGIVMEYCDRGTLADCVSF